VAAHGGAVLRWLARQPPGIDEARCSVEHMIKDADRATHIIGGLRDLTKQNAPRAEVVDLNEAIAEVIAMTYSEAVKTGVTVGTQLAGEAPHIQCDRVQLQQVMLNLIVNAIQSMSSVEDGARELHISTASIEAEGVCVAVRDTGHGLRPDSLPRLFEPSTRRSSTAWAWASRSAARLSKPMVGGCGRPGASREARSFSLRSH